MSYLGWATSSKMVSDLGFLRARQDSNLRPLD
jgi:hypothetical protein